MTDLADLKTIVRQEIAALRKDIDKQERVLRDAQEQLALHENIAAMLQSGPAPAQTTPRPAPRKAPAATKKKATKKRARKTAKKAAKKKTPAKKRTVRTDWNAVLERLPASFTPAEVKDAAGSASNYADVHQALLRWRKAGSVKTNGRGQYKKA